MGRYLDIAKKLENKRPLTTEKSGCNGDAPNDSEISTFVLPIPPTQSDGNHDLTFIDHLTEVEREAYLSLVEIMQTSLFGMDRETAERKAGGVVAKKRSPLQVRQGAEDRKRYGYTKIFSTALGRAFYLARDQTAARRVPDKNIPVFVDDDLEAVKELDTEAKIVLLEARLIFGGPLKVGDYAEPKTAIDRKLGGHAVAKAILGEGSKK